MSKEKINFSGSERKKNKKVKPWVIVLCVILAVVLLLAIGVFAFVNNKLNKIPDEPNDETSFVETPDDIANDNKDIAGEDLQGADTDVYDLPKEEIFKDDNVVNILLLGTDDIHENFSNNARADSMILLSLNKKTHAVKLVSFERGMGVPIPGSQYKDWLTHTFRYGGANLTINTIKDCFRVDVDKYIRVNFCVFQKVVDVLGGVDINLTQAEADHLNEQNLGVNVGANHLNGKQALAYSRIRHIDSDWMRIQRQRTTIQAIANSSKDLSLSQLNKLADTILPLVQTNLSKGEIVSLVLEAPGFRGVQADQLTIPKKGTYHGVTQSNGRNYFAVDFVENSRILKSFLYDVN